MNFVLKTGVEAQRTIFFGLSQDSLCPPPTPRSVHNSSLDTPTSRRTTDNVQPVRTGRRRRPHRTHARVIIRCTQRTRYTRTGRARVRKPARARTHARTYFANRRRRRRVVPRPYVHAFSVRPPRRSRAAPRNNYCITFYHGRVRTT